MDSPEAKVVAVGQGRVTVSVDPMAACPRCAAGRGCGAGLLGRRSVAELEVKVAAGLVLEPGDRVRLEFAPAPVLYAAWLAYGLPLAGLVAGALAGSSIGSGGEPGAVLGALSGLGAGALLGRRALSRNGQIGACVPTATERSG